MSVQAIPQPWHIEPKDVQIKQVIITQLKSAGDGIPGDPYRIVTQFWDMEGNLIASFDKHQLREEQ